MVAETKIAKRTARTRVKTQLKAPFLDYLIFTKCSSERTAGADGVPSPFSPKGSFLELTASPRCAAVEDAQTKLVRAALSLGLEAKASSGEEEAVFYSGEVRAVGFFICDPSMTATDIEKAATDKNSYFAAAFEVVHAIASRELERQIELTGIPAPLIPMSGNIAENDERRKKPKP